MYKILLVDDEIEIMKVLEVFFAKRGFEVLSATRALGALELVEANDDIDVMVLDIKMPEMSGVELLKELKKRGKAIPLIFLSGSISHQQHLGDLLELGYVRQDILDKPIDLNELYTRVREKLGISE